MKRGLKHATEKARCMQIAPCFLQHASQPVVEIAQQRISAACIVLGVLIIGIDLALGFGVSSCVCREAPDKLKNLKPRPGSLFWSELHQILLRSPFWSLSIFHRRDKAYQLVA